MVSCLNCDKVTKNKKFCSRSCSSSYNNRKYPKRKLEGSCNSCETPIKSDRKFCKDCRSEALGWLGDLTLKEAKYDKHHRSSAYALVRSRARRVTSKREQVCVICNYDKHVETCHIKGIAEFSEDAVISEVNNEDNLVLLCPNCHWEFDNNLLKIIKGE